ncbi:DDE-type integrase/transposase/recombinase [Glaciimonas immobilis]|uniref:DDE-type integrase/transposase/recombinase n=1 Tax=Glaciimonas immobilis TaxID=728004 RepID=UPI00143AFBB7|nr:DDE-type integrase/transposase/recombinase [Glaciimonas immobilis]
MSDITYVWTKQGWLYLAPVLDLYSRKIVGSTCAFAMQTNLISKALLMAIQLRQLASGVVFHSNRGIHYASAKYQTLLV